MQTKQAIIGALLRGGVSAGRNVLKPALQAAVSPAGQRVIAGGLAGAGLSELENRHYLSEIGEKNQDINSLIGTITGAALPTRHAGKALLSWPFKTLGMLYRADKNKEVENQLPIARMQLQAAEAGVTAASAQQAAADQQRRAAIWGAVPGALGSLTLAGGLGLLVHELRKREQRRKGTVRVRLPTRNPSDQETMVDIPLEVLPHTTYKDVLRDTRRKLRGESEERVKRKGADNLRIANEALREGAAPEAVFGGT